MAEPIFINLENGSILSGGGQLFNRETDRLGRRFKPPIGHRVLTYTPFAGRVEFCRRGKIEIVHIFGTDPHK